MTYRLYLVVVFLLSYSIAASAATILYTVEQNGKVSYIIGTVHSVQAELSDVHPQLPGIIDNSRVLLLESFGDGNAIYDLMNLFLKQKAQSSQFDKLSSGVLKRLKSFLSGLDGDTFDLKRTWRSFHPGIFLRLLSAEVDNVRSTIEYNIHGEGRDGLINVTLERL